MGVETKVYWHGAWARGNMHNPKGLVLVAATYAFYVNTDLVMSNENGRYVSNIPRRTLDQVNDRDVINIGTIFIPFAARSNLERVVNEYEVLSRINNSVKSSLKDPVIGRRFLLFYETVQQYLSSRNSLKRARLMYKLEQMGKQFEFSRLLYLLISDLVQKNRILVDLRLDQFQAIVEQNYEEAARLRSKINDFISARARVRA